MDHLSRLNNDSRLTASLEAATEARLEKTDPGSTETVSRKTQAGFIKTAGQAENEIRASEILSAQNRVLLRTLSALIMEPDLSRILYHLLSGITEELGAHSAALCLYEADGQPLVIAECRSGSIPLEPAAESVTPTGPDLTPGTECREAFLIREISESDVVDVTAADWMKREGVKSLLCLPLTFGDEIAGVLTLRGLAANTFSRREEQLGAALGQQACFGAEILRLAQQWAESAVLKERNRIAQEIHDSLAQNLTAIGMRLEIAKTATALDAVLPQINAAQELTRESALDAQRSVWALRPRSLEGRELADALNDLVQSLNDVSVQTHFTQSGTVSKMPAGIEDCILRMCQEALGNALKHANPTAIQVELVYGSAGVTLIVEDNGKGFDVAGVKGGRGFGFSSMEQRAKRAKGNVNISSEPGRGTRIVAEFPLGPESQMEKKR